MHDDVRNCRETINSIKQRSNVTASVHSSWKGEVYSVLWGVLEIQDFREITEILPRQILGDKGRQPPQSLIICSDVILTKDLELYSSSLFDRQGES